jgi:hypothetical protein
MGGKSKTKIKVPKRVAGVKIPKAVRKGPVLQFVNSSAGRLLVAEALTAAVGLFAYQRSQGENGKGIADTARNAEEMLKQNTARLTFAFGEAVRAFREALTQPDQVGRDDAESGEELPVVSKKNLRRSASETTGP